MRNIDTLIIIAIAVIALLILFSLNPNDSCDTNEHLSSTPEYVQANYQTVNGRNYLKMSDSLYAPNILSSSVMAANIGANNISAATINSNLVNAENANIRQMNLGGVPVSGELIQRLDSRGTNLANSVSNIQSELRNSDSMHTANGALLQRLDAQGTNLTNSISNIHSELRNTNSMYTANGTLLRQMESENVNLSKLVSGIRSEVASLPASGNVVGFDRGADGNPVIKNVKFSQGWTGYPDNRTDGAEISNDTNAYKKLMIVGNKSAGGGRKVGVWDQLDVHGKLTVNEKDFTNISTDVDQLKQQMTQNQSNNGFIKDANGNPVMKNVKFSQGWTGYPDGRTDGAEISNDIANFKTLMIVGNKSAGNNRKVGIWDELTVNGGLYTKGPHSGSLLLNNGHVGHSNGKHGNNGCSEISNDLGNWKQLMIVGNSSAGGARKVGLWDELNVHGTLLVNNKNIVQAINEARRKVNLPNI